MKSRKMVPMNLFAGQQRLCGAVGVAPWPRSGSAEAATVQCRSS